MQVPSGISSHFSSHLLHHHPHIDDNKGDHDDALKSDDDQVDAVDRVATLDGDLGIETEGDANQKSI